MYFREAIMETLDEMITSGEIEKIITTLKTHKKNIPNVFERRKEIKKIKKFVEMYVADKTKYGKPPHWIPTITEMPEYIMRDLLCIMASKYNCELYGKAEFIKEEEKDV